MAIRLKNVCGGVRGLGGSPKGKHTQGVRLLPGEIVKLTKEQVELFKDEKQPHRQVLAHYLKSGEIIDMDEEFNDLLGMAPKEAEADDDEPAAVQAAPATQAFTGGDALTPDELAKLPEEKALAAVLDVNEIATLRAWFGLDQRQSVREQINKRGAFLAAQGKK